MSPSYDIFHHISPNEIPMFDATSPSIFRSQQDILQKQEVLEAYSVRGHELFTDVWEGTIAAYLFLTQKKSAFCSLKIVDLSLFPYMFSTKWLDRWR